MSSIKDLLLNLKVILASASPQRIAILHQIGLKFEAYPSSFDEETVPKDSFKNPRDYVKHLAHQKAITVAKLFMRKDYNVLVIGADTVIVHDDRIIGKPFHADAAKDTLRELSGKTHQVCTGVSVIKVEYDKLSETMFDEVTSVQFGDLTEDDIISYVRTGESMNKAGSYGIQGKGAVLVSGINGDYNNVVGFPAYKFCQETRKFLRGQTSVESS